METPVARARRDTWGGAPRGVDLVRSNRRGNAAPTREDLLALDEAGRLDRWTGRLLPSRSNSAYFAGLSVDQAAVTLGLSWLRLIATVGFRSGMAVFQVAGEEGSGPTGDEGQRFF